MFWNKQLREAEKVILSDAENEEQSNGDKSVINVKIENKEQLFLSYSYSGDKLNSEFSEYVYDKAKNVPIGEPVKIKIHTADDLNADEVDKAIKSHYRSEYMQSKKAIKRLLIIAAIMTVLGVIALSALILINHFTDNLYLTSIVEIAAWVFIWEAVDIFFLQRPTVKARCVLLLRIYSAATEICREQPTGTENQ